LPCSWRLVLTDKGYLSIVLVHGLGANYDTTWLAEEPENSITSDTSGHTNDTFTSGAKVYVNWITKFLVADLDHTNSSTTRMYFLNYDSYWKRDALDTRLRSMADKLLSSLEHVRNSETVWSSQAFF
jgi:hypothetical protein